ncbi:hypothetical protein SMJ63A_140047 [Stenotrophomonas geniculata]
MLAIVRLGGQVMFCAGFFWWMQEVAFEDKFHHLEESVPALLRVIGVRALLADSRLHAHALMTH